MADDHQQGTKTAVRERMRKTGERYAAARQHLVADGAAERTAAAPESDEAASSIVERPGMSEEAIRKGSGKTWSEWLHVLDTWGAQTRTHTEIAEYVYEQFEMSGWYAQGVAVGYERMRGMREHGQRFNGNYSGSASKTFPVPVGDLFAAWTDERRRDRWLDPGTLGLRTSQPDKSARFDVPDDGSIIAVSFVDKGARKSSVQVQHDKLPSKAAASQFRMTWKERLARLSEVLTAS